MQGRAATAATRIADLADRAQRGDQDAFGALVKLMWPQLVALARTILAGDDEAEDLAQEALVQAWARLGSLRRLKGLPYGLTETAIEAVKQWRFEPARQDDKPVSVIYNITINFRLEEKAKTEQPPTAG